MNILNYFIEANISLVFFYGLYSLLLRHENQFAVQRLVLVGGLVLSLIIPLIHFENLPTVFQSTIPTLNDAMPSYWLPEVVVGNEISMKETNSIYNTWSISIWFFPAISILLLAMLIARIRQILSLAKQSRAYLWNNLWIHEVDQPLTAFSFFNMIFIGKNDLNENEREKVLQHEAVHVRHYHSIDILFIQFVRAVFWFNPIVYFYQKSLTQLHEYEADAKAVRPEETETYCELLAKTALASNGLIVANHFSNALLVKRIRMMKTLKNKIHRWKIATVSILMVIIAVMIACQDQLGHDTVELQEKDLPPEVIENLNNAKRNYPSAQFEVLKVNNSEKVDYKSAIYSIRTITSDGNQYIIVINDPRYFTYPKDESEVFTQVENMAMPIGGFDSFYDQLAQALIYPVDAREKHQEDKVFIEFIVNTDGKLSDIKVVKGKYESLNTEAERVILQMANSNWLPALNNDKIVKQRMVLPITFKL